jgi:hypothetical protein
MPTFDSGTEHCRLPLRWMSKASVEWLRIDRRRKLLPTYHFRVDATVRDRKSKPLRHL